MVGAWERLGDMIPPVAGNQTPVTGWTSMVCVSMMLLAALLPIAHRHNLVTLKRNPYISILVYSEWQRHVHQSDLPCLTSRNLALEIVHFASCLTVQNSIQTVNSP